MPRRRFATERQSDLDHLVARLAALDASREEMRQVIDTWDTFDDDWTPERRREVVRAPDATLRAMLAERRAEFPFEPEAPDVRYEQAAGAVVMGLETAPAPVKQRARRAGSGG